MANQEGKDGVYRPTPLKLTTLSDLVALKGTAATLVGNASIVVDPSNPRLAAASTPAQVASLFLTNPGGAVRGNFLQSNGAYWPMDFHTWNEATLYANFEAADLFFLNEVQVTAQELNALPVYYWPSYSEPGVSSTPLTDNLFYSPPVQGFVALPFDTHDQGMPLAMVSGAVAQSVGHYVFNLRTYSGAPFPIPYSTWASSGPNAANVMQSVENGVSQMFAYGASCATVYGCSTNYLSAALTSGQASALDFGASGQCMTSGLQHDLNTLSYANFLAAGDDLLVGTLVAAALYTAALATGGRQTLEQSMLASLNDSAPGAQGLAQLITQFADTPSAFTLGSVTSVIVSHVPDPVLRARLCQALIDRLQLQSSSATPAGPDIPAACAGSTSGTACPKLP
jgi:hypothetical protein